MIEKNVIISVRGEQYFEDIDPDTVELTTEGRMTIVKNRTGASGTSIATLLYGWCSYIG